MSKEKKEEEKKKKEPIFRKQENGMIMIAENMIAVGFPKVVETMEKGKAALVIPFGAGKGEGTKYSKVEYDWHIISGSPLPPKEIEKLAEPIAISSGTIVASLDNATVLPVTCKKCGHLNLYGKFCSYCGNPL